MVAKKHLVNQIFEQFQPKHREISSTVPLYPVEAIFATCYNILL